MVDITTLRQYCVRGMDFRTIFEVVFPVFFIIGIGFTVGRFLKIDLTSITKLILYVLAPSLVFSSLSNKVIDPVDLGKIFFSVLGIISIMGVVTWGLLKGMGKLDTLRGLLLPVMFMNCANMGLPLILGAFGESAFIIGVLFYVCVATLHFSLGVAIVSGWDFREVFKFPLVYAVAVALSLNFSGVTIPEIIFTPINNLGMATIPIMLFSLGYSLNGVKVTSIKYSLLGVFLRIVGGFACANLMVWVFHLEGNARSVVILVGSLPSAVINFVIAERFGKNPELVSSVVLIGTLMSLVTAPLVLYYLMNF